MVRRAYFQEVKAKFESLDPIHRRRVRVGVRVHEQTCYVRAQYGASAIEFPFNLQELSSPECADHLVLSMYGHPSRSRLEGKGSLSSRTLKYEKSPQVCNQSVINQ